MKLDKLTKQLRRDLAANPKKAAALGLMALVALYFWAPLAWRWFAPEGGRPSADALGLILKDDPEEPAAAAKRRGGKFRWEKVRQLIAADARMVPAAFQAAWNDPFAGQTPPPTSVARGPTNSALPMSPAMLASEWDPQQAGLVLSSVLIGPRRKTATINGETYLEGSLVRVAGAESALAAIEFRVTRITSRGVELERSGKRFALLLPRPGLAEGDQIERSKDSE